MGQKFNYRHFLFINILEYFIWICPHLHVSQNVLECLDLVITLRMYPEDLISAETTSVSQNVATNYIFMALKCHFPKCFGSF